MLTPWARSVMVGLTTMVGLAPSPVGYQALSPVEAASHWWKRL